MTTEEWYTLCQNLIREAISRGEIVVFDSYSPSRGGDSCHPHCKKSVRTPLKLLSLGWCNKEP